jgi:hypothetical protein
MFSWAAITNTKQSPKVGKKPLTASSGVVSCQRDWGTSGRAAAIVAWASSRAWSSVAFEGYRLASLDGLEFQSKRAAALAWGGPAACLSQPGRRRAGPRSVMQAAAGRRCRCRAARRPRRRLLDRAPRAGRSSDAQVGRRWRRPSEASRETPWEVRSWRRPKGRRGPANQCGAGEVHCNLHSTRRETSPCPRKVLSVPSLSPPFHARRAIHGPCGLFFARLPAAGRLFQWRNFRRTRCNPSGCSGFCRFVRLGAIRCGRQLRRVVCLRSGLRPSLRHTTLILVRQLSHNHWYRNWGGARR